MRTISVSSILLFFVGVFFRHEFPFTVVVVDIASLAVLASYDPTALQNALWAALTTVVSDTFIGSYSVGLSGSVFIGTPTIGMHRLSESVEYVTVDNYNLTLQNTQTV